MEKEDAGKGIDWRMGRTQKLGGTENEEQDAMQSYGRENDKGRE